MATSRRVPCESADCDSTTPEFTFPTSTERSISSGSNITSYQPLDLDELNDKRDLSILQDPFGKSLQSNDDDLDSIQKGPDTTFNPLGVSVHGAPPAYVPLSENQIMNYGPAVPRGQQRHDVALAKLAPIRDLPVTILGYGTLHQLSLRLDPEMLPSQNWRMMAEYMGFNNWEIRAFDNCVLKTKDVIEAWAAGSHSLGELLDIIQYEMQRLDVITDLPECFLRDAQRHRNPNRRSGSGSGSYSRSISATSIVSQQIANNLASPGMTHIFQDGFGEKCEQDNMSSPVQVTQISPSVPVQQYDAFVLCNMADQEFVVKKFLPKVEDEAHLKLCFTHRDIQPGKLAIIDQMNYMFLRSKKLVVIISDEFFNSQEHDWQSNLAISRDPVAQTQRIIPVKYKKTKPNIFDCLGCCDLTKTMKEEWFWEKIINGIKS